MGLDVYAVKVIPEAGSVEAFPEAPEEAFRGVPRLAGGWFAGGGSGAYFRGNSYWRYITSVTGVSLRQGFIQPETVAKMAEALEADRSEGRWRKFGLDEHTARALTEWFKVCAANRFGIRVDW